MTEFAGIRAFAEAQVHAPLLASRRMGVVTNIDNRPDTVTVLIGGDTETEAEVPYISSYLPNVDDVVVMLSVDGDHCIIGSITRSTPTRFQAILDRNQTINTGGYTTLTAWTSVPITTLSGFNATTGVFTVPDTGLYKFEARISAVTVASFTTLIFGIFVNTVADFVTRQPTTVSQTSVTMPGKEISLTKNDTVDFEVQPIGANTTTSSGGYASWIRVERLT